MTVHNDEVAFVRDGERFEIKHPEGVMRGWHYPALCDDPSRAARLMFVHATGFCASVYRQIFTNYLLNINVWSVDMRGHGTTTLPTDSTKLKDWHVYAADLGIALDSLNELTSRVEPVPWVLAGHSMGGVTATMSVAGHDGAGRDDVGGICLIEPVAMPEILTKIASSIAWPFLITRFPIVVSARKRRSQWHAYQDTLSSYAKKPLFADWEKGVLEDYLLDGLIADDAGVKLACAPDWEAATFGAQANPFWRNAKAIGRRNRVQGEILQSAQVLAGKIATSTVPVFAEKRLKRFGFDVIRDDRHGHLLPMEAPQRAAEFLEGACWKVKASKLRAEE